MNNILITGGAGFIGTNLARQLITAGHQVTIFDNFLYQIHGGVEEIDETLKGKVTVIKGDVQDRDAFYNALQNKDCVIHLAAETGTGQSMYNISHYTNVNIQGTAILCDYMVNEKNSIEKVIVASSRSIYGEGKYLSKEFGNVYPSGRIHESLKESFEVACPVSGRHDLELCATDEASLIHPSSIYGITKQMQEQMVILSARIKKITAFSLRFQNVYGPGQSLKNPYTGILSVFSRLALKNEPINIFEDGLESRDFVYIADVVDAITKCLDTNDHDQYILNVGSGVPTTVHEVAKEIVSYLNSKSEISISGSFREGDIRHNYADLTLVQSVIGFEPKWSFKDGLHSFLDWVLKQNDIPDTMDDYERSINELKSRGLYK